jgi:hypothetical protein
MMSSLHAFPQTSGLLPILGQWQSLIAGLLGLLAGLVAFGGALIAACLQVRAMRRTAAAQVAAMQQTTADQLTAVRLAAQDQVDAVEAQIADLQAERQKTDERRLRVIKQAVKVEGRRLEAAATAMRQAIGEHGWATGKGEQLITSSPLLQGEREDMALLDDTTFDLVEQAADVVNEYNATMESKLGAPGGTLFHVPPGVPVLLERLIQIAGKLRGLTDGRTEPGN